MEGRSEHHKATTATQSSLTACLTKSENPGREQMGAGASFSPEPKHSPIMSSFDYQPQKCVTKHELQKIGDAISPVNGLV